MMSSASGAEIWVGIDSDTFEFQPWVLEEHTITKEELEGDIISVIQSNFNSYGDAFKVGNLGYSINWDSGEDHIIGFKLNDVEWGNMEVDLSRKQEAIDALRDISTSHDDIKTWLVSVYF